MRTLRSLLKKKATKEDLEALAGIFKIDHASIDSIIDAFQWNSTGAFSYWLSTKNTYKEILINVCIKLGIKPKKRDSQKILEEKIALYFFEKVLSKMSEEKRTALLNEFSQTNKIDKEKTNAMKKAASTGTVMALLSAGGFPVYVAATTALGAITGVLGITLPFAAYTTLTSMISTILGPVGWVGLGLFTIMKVTGANYKKLIPAILMVAVIRNNEPV